jgi:RNA polymerase sigma factor (TIGR02999 family)
MSESPETSDVTRLLVRWREGSAEAEAQLLAAVHHELRRIAAAYMRRERRDHSLQPTALINEAYIRLAPQRTVEWEGRTHFFGIAARVMRQVLVDHARRRRALKRPPGRAAVSASRIADPSTHADIDVLALHEALEQLAALDARQAEIVELRYFGGLTEEEVAAVKGLSPATVRRDVASARFFLGQRMRGIR